MAGFPSNDFAQAYAICRYPRKRTHWKSAAEMETVIRNQLLDANFSSRFDRRSRPSKQLRRIVREVRRRWTVDNDTEFEEHGHVHNSQKQAGEATEITSEAEERGAGQRGHEDGPYQESKQTPLLRETRGAVDDVKEEEGEKEKKIKKQAGVKESELSKLHQGGFTTTDQPAAVCSGRKRNQEVKGNRPSKKLKGAGKTFNVGPGAVVHVYNP